MNLGHIHNHITVAIRTPQKKRKQKLRCGLLLVVKQSIGLMEAAKLYKKKAPKKGREKETRAKDQSPGKQTAEKRRAARR